MYIYMSMIIYMSNLFPSRQKELRTDASSHPTRCGGYDLCTERLNDGQDHSPKGFRASIEPYGALVVPSQVPLQCPWRAFQLNWIAAGHVALQCRVESRTQLSPEHGNGRRYLSESSHHMLLVLMVAGSPLAQSSRESALMSFVGSRIFAVSRQY